MSGIKSNYKIAICGSHGIRKSTMANYLAFTLKNRYPEKNIGLINENIREIKQICNGEMNTFKFMKMCLFDQLWKENRFSYIYDISITDRSILDCFMYYEQNNKNVHDDYSYYFDFMLHNLDTYDKIYYIRPSDNHIIDDGFRFTNPEERNEIDKRFEQFFNQYYYYTFQKRKIIEIESKNILNFDYIKDLKL